MRRSIRHTALLVFIGIQFLALAGCQIGAVNFDDQESGNGDGGGGGDVQCEGPLGPPRDPSTLTACCEDFVGGAHCLAGDTVPGELSGYLDDCAGGGYCVPDKFIETGGVYTPKTCTSMNDEPGVCLSGCIPMVDQYWGVLPQDTCDDTERCAPCINPLDGMDTGACAIHFECGDDDPFGDGGGGDGGGGSATCPYEGEPILDPSSFPACTSCNGGAHCVPNDLVPADFSDRLAACDGASKCVPDEFIETAGNTIPATCQSIAGFEGRCLSTCLPEVAGQADLLPQSSCTANQKCVPCYDPLTGEATGACNLSCDPGPQSGPQQLPACCGNRGTCVPVEAAGDNADQLGEDTCTGGLVCAPNDFLQPSFTPQACETGAVSLLFGNDYKPGVCLPDCLPAVDNFLLGQDGCNDGYKCAPCLDPLTGEPSGACDL